MARQRCTETCTWRRALSSAERGEESMLWGKKCLGRCIAMHRNLWIRENGMWKEPWWLKTYWSFISSRKLSVQLKNKCKWITIQKTFYFAKAHMTCLRVWCTLFRDGLQGYMLGAYWATTQIQQVKGFTGTSPALYCPAFRSKSLRTPFCQECSTTGQR